MVDEIIGRIWIRRMRKLRSRWKRPRNRRPAPAPLARALPPAERCRPAFGLCVAFYTAKSITEPLNHLITVAREIGDSGDLDQNIDIHRNDEIGALATTFNNMVAYLKEMAGVSMAVAEGDLAVEVVPRSKRDTLGNAFLRMSHGLQELVRTTRDSAGQVSAGSNQVAGAADESAKVSVQASSAIEEVTSTMHEMSINVQNVVKNTQVQASSVAETSASIDQMVTSIQRVADTAKVSARHRQPFAGGSRQWHCHDGEGYRRPQPHESRHSVFGGNHQCARTPRRRHRKDHRSDR